MNRLRKNRRSDRNSGRIFLLSGAALIIAAALMFGGYLYDGYHTRAYGERILTELLPLIPDRVPGTVPDTIREDEQAVLEYTWRITGIVNGEETDMQDSGLVLITRDRMTGERRAVLCTRI